MPYEYIWIKYTPSGISYGTDNHYSPLWLHRIQLSGCPWISIGGQPDHFCQLFLSGSQCRRHWEPDNRATGTKYQWYPGHPVSIQRQPAGTKPYYGRIWTFSRPGNCSKWRTWQSFPCPTLSAPGLWPADCIKSRCRCDAYFNGCPPKRQTLTAWIKWDCRLDCQRAVTDHLWCK